MEEERRKKREEERGRGERRRMEEMIKKGRWVVGGRERKLKGRRRKGTGKEGK